MKTALFSLLLYLVGTTCFAQDTLFRNIEPEVFTLTADTQVATFYIDVHWVGGGGTMPILDLDIWRPKRLSTLPIYFDQSYSKMVDDKLPDCHKGRPRIMIRAKIYLRKVEETITSNPPRNIFVYEAVVLELYDIIAAVNPCN